ncbi:VCBS repeat [uncultured Caudovirales phage]|uniref:VCBS repeat n=1 Tax=uncultured Caudovirales phage TaxID=2100421 RepID=A0A6J5MJZ8_9CAUD|nr:VCBS repeat [uncultured Caudovirales phage]
MSLPNITVSIRPDSSFINSGNAILGTSLLGTMILGPAANAMVDLTGTVTDVSIKRGRTRVTDSFDTGTASVTVIDTTGQFNPDNTSSNLYPYVLPLRQFRISAVVNGVLIQLFNGYVSKFTYNYEVGTNLTYVTIEAEDAFRLLGLANVEIITGATFGEATGTRIGRILTQLNVPTTLRTISTGQSVCWYDPETVRSALEAIQQVEATELGAFYVDSDGKYTFKSRHEIQQLAAGLVNTPLVFNETTGLRYRQVQVGFDDQAIYNTVTIQGEGIVDTAVSDATSISNYFTRSYVRGGSLITTDAEATSQATLLLNSRKDPSLTLDSIQCQPLAMSDADAYKVINADVLDPVTLTKVYASSSITRTLTIQGIDHSIRPDTWDVTFALAEPVGGDAFVLDSTNAAILDTNVLSY